ncbi:MAG: RDD family protein [Planctomycetes bacterium]|nr:RDD family protein [Planctomycetota bacterium]
MSAAPEVLLVTPEHVEIRLVPAGLGSRFLALLIDGLLVILAGIALSIGIAIALAPFPGIAYAVIATAFFLLRWGYDVWFEVRHDGRTIGKRAAGIRVVDRRGLPVTLRQSIVRNFLRAFDSMPIAYGVGALVALFDRHRRRLGDLIADTIVIEETRSFAALARLPWDDTARSLATPATIRRIRHRLDLEERELLLALCLRGGRLPEAARYDLMEAAADHFRRKLGIEERHLSGEKLVKGIAGIAWRRAGE